VVLRVNGYFPPHQLMTALEYVAGGHEKSGGFREFYAKKSPPLASGRLHSRPQFLKPPFALAKRGDKPLLVLFEQKVCGGCDFLHQTIFEDPESRALLARFDVAQLDMWSDTPVTTPEGRRTTAREWARDLGLVYAPSAVLYGADNREVLRVEAMLKTFHVQSVMDYVASNAYREQPNLQRYIDERAGALRAQGVQIDLWN
jgi:thioredoxin-related protein